jgi:tetratricopeptide (TPR) repeat protein
MMRTPSARTGLSALCLLAAALSVVSAQSEQSAPLPVKFREPIQLYTVGLGKFARPISSKNAEAQAFFNQGFQMMYSFAKPEAVRSFRAAWKSDPDCAICYWGEAWAWGSYLNEPMPSEDAPFAYAAIRKALTLTGHATAVERAFIDAMAVRYVEHFDAKKRVDQDKAYAEATRRVSETYPKDLEAATLYGEALFLLEPRRGTRSLDDPNVQRLHAVLEKVLAVDNHHPGACHLYVHATESTVRPQKAEACAEFLGQSIPGASHMNHMPSHTWNRVGRWGDSVRANLDAPDKDVPAGLWDFGQGYARLRLGDADFAKAHLARLQKLADTSKASFRTHSAKELLGIVGGILEGEIARAAGDLPAAIAAFDRAAKLEDAMQYDEPEPLPFAVGHWLGAALLEADRNADAERVYRAELDHHAHNGGSLTGLRLALKAQSKSTTDVDQDLAASWARSDTWIRSSRF